MKTRETTPGKTYSVHTSSGCTISDKNGWSKTIDAPDGYFTAHAGEVTIDGDDAADIRELFKLAPQQRLALLGVLGGNGGLPAGYKRVEYLEAPGEVRKHPYIMLGREFNKDTKYEFVASATRNDVEFFGAWDISSRTAVIKCMFMSGSGALIKVAGTNFSVNKYTFVDKVTFVIDLATGNIKINDRETKVKTETALSLLAGIPYAIFAVNYTKDAIIGGNGSRIFSYKETQGDKMLVNLVPCIDTTGAPCMYDTVGKKAFYNQGAYDFTYPTESTTYSLRRVLPDWGKLTERGLRRLYHVPSSYKGELYDYALEHGYKPIIEPEQPETGYWAPRWTETEDEIVLEWVETEPPMDEFGLPEETLT